MAFNKEELEKLRNMITAAKVLLTDLRAIKAAGTLPPGMDEELRADVEIIHANLNEFVETTVIARFGE